MPRRKFIAACILSVVLATVAVVCWYVGRANEPTLPPVSIYQMYLMQERAPSHRYRLLHGLHDDKEWQQVAPSSIRMGEVQLFRNVFSRHVPYLRSTIRWEVIPTVAIHPTTTISDLPTAWRAIADEMNAEPGINFPRVRDNLNAMCANNSPLLNNHRLEWPEVHYSAAPYFQLGAVVLGAGSFFAIAYAVLLIVRAKMRVELGNCPLCAYPLSPVGECSECGYRLGVKQAARS